METTELRDRLHAAVNDFLWDQWTSIGLAGHAVGPGIPFVIDPEALLLATLRFAMDDGRFRGEVLDWLTRNGALLSVQRMKNLDLTMRVAPLESVSGLSAFMQTLGHPNWKTLGARNMTTRITDFSDSRARGMSQPPDPSRPEAFLLRMRLLFGVNARAEVLTWLFTHAEGHAALIARETAWFSKSVQAILNDLEQAGLLLSRTEGKRRDVSLRPQGGIWHPHLATPLRWFTQAPFHVGIHHVLHALEHAASPRLSDQARAIALRGDITSLETSFRLAGLMLYSGVGKERGGEMISQFHDQTQQLIHMLKTRADIGKSNFSPTATLEPR